MALLNSKKDEIFKLIENNGFSPAQFVLKDTKYGEGETMSLLLFNNTSYSFSFGNDANRFLCLFSPGKDILEESIIVGSWDKTIPIFVKWLYYLEREISTPNYWDRINTEMGNYKLHNYGTDDNKFDIKELEQVKSKIKLLKEEIRKIDIPKEDILKINSKLDHLMKMAESLSKIDWKNLFVGAMINLSIDLALNPNHSKALIEILKKIFNTMFLN